MSGKRIGDLQQPQSEISIDIEQIERYLSLSSTGSSGSENIYSANEFRKWKADLWDEIRTGTSETMGQFLSVAAAERRIINGINTPFWAGGPPMLHIVIRKKFDAPVVLMLVNLIPSEELVCKDDNGQTALHVAIHSDNISTAMLLIKRKPMLATMRDKQLLLPVLAAARKQEKELAFHLHQLTISKFRNYEESDLLLQAASSGWFEMVLYILGGDPELEWLKMEPLLTYFVNEPRAFPSRTPLTMLQSFIYSNIEVNPVEEMACFIHKEMLNSEEVDFDERKFRIKVMKGLFELQKVPKKIWQKLVQPIEDVRRAKVVHRLTSRTLRNVCREMSNVHLTDERLIFGNTGLNKSIFDASSVKSVFFSAAQIGIHEMIELILDEYPEAIDSRNDEGHSVLDLAAMYRHEKVFMIALKKGQHIKEETILFQVAENAQQSLVDSGSQAVFQMQRELQWFKEIEKLMPLRWNSKNKEKKTPIQVFKETHQDLINYENKWMLEMANSCIVGGSLIATVVFAASITVPGGNNSNSGLPIFLNISAYQVFSIANGLSLTFSLTSVLIFLSIFTARHSVNDYLYSLPTRIIFGLIFLFLSVLSLMVDFTAIAVLVSGPENMRSIFIIAVSACIPVGFFASLQLPSLVNMIKSTFGSNGLKEYNQQMESLFRRSEVLVIQK